MNQFVFFILVLSYSLFGPIYFVRFQPLDCVEHLGNIHIQLRYEFVVTKKRRELFPKCMVAEVLTFTRHSAMLLPLPEMAHKDQLSCYESIFL
jgi:hypothetical protein